MSIASTDLRSNISNFDNLNTVTSVNKELSNTKVTARLSTTMISDMISDSWQAQLADTVTDVDELLSLLNLSHIRGSLYVPETFKLRVPRGFVAKMQSGNPNDPLLKQVLPLIDETYVVAGYGDDPLQEAAHNPTKGLLHKYQSRVLVTATGACAVHCRYCFRQHFDYQANMAAQHQIGDMQAYITSQPQVTEVILSGGDPLSLSSRRLDHWLAAFEALPQIKTIRIHSRLPIVIPERLDDELNKRLQASRCHIVMVIHSNHSAEIDQNTQALLQLTREHGVVLLNQTVLLAGINDTATEQALLSHRLFEAGVLPYYLHLLDKVAGAAHFAVEKSAAIDLYWQMLAQLPGYLVPKLVEELPFKPFKTPVDLYS